MKKDSNKKIIKKFQITGFIIIVFCLAVSFLIFNKQQSVTKEMPQKQTERVYVYPTFPQSLIENWNIYTNKELGFTLRYPSTWSIYERKGAVTFYNGQKLKTAENSPIDPYPVSFVVYKRPGTTAQEACDNEACVNLEDSNSVYKAEKIKINNAEGIKLISPYTDGGDYYLAGNGKAVRLLYATHEEKDFSTNKRTFELIFSTFTFLD